MQIKCDIDEKKTNGCNKRNVIKIRIIVACYYKQHLKNSTQDGERHKNVLIKITSIADFALEKEKVKTYMHTFDISTIFHKVT